MKKSLLIALCMEIVPALLCSSKVYAVNNTNINTEYTQFASNVPNVTQYMLSPDFWINNCLKPNDVIMNENQIGKYNKDNISSDGPVVDLENYKTYFTKDELTKMITNLSSPSSSERYDKNGKLATKNYYDNLKSNLNIDGLGKTNQVKYGITVKRTMMKTFPTSDTLYKSGDNYEFDRFAETAVYPVEPLVILSTSKDKNWYFAQMYNYLAWIPVKDVALTDKNTLFSYIDNKNFLVVTGKYIHTNYDPLNSDISELQLDMGIKIPLAGKEEIPNDIDMQNPAGNYVVKLPTRNDSGNLVLKLSLIPMSEDINIGYLPYTETNIIKQAFKFQGQRYGWSGMFNSRDCSAFVMDIYRTMGLKLQRNTGEQAKKAVGIYIDLSKLTDTQRNKTFDSLDPGTALYMDGHAMLYLGKYNNRYYMIHDFSGFYKTGIDGKQNYYKSREVAVTPLDIGLDSNKQTYMEALYCAKRFVLKN